MRWNSTLNNERKKDGAVEKNVNGGRLKSCSSVGMALTGWTRNGYCAGAANDRGSHHICIDLSSTSGGNFCKVTAQPNWCSAMMPCHEDMTKKCQVKKW